MRYDVKTPKFGEDEAILTTVVGTPMNAVPF